MISFEKENKELKKKVEILQQNLDMLKRNLSKSEADNKVQVESQKNQVSLVKIDCKAGGR